MVAAEDSGHVPEEFLEQGEGVAAVAGLTGPAGDVRASGECVGVVGAEQVDAMPPLLKAMHQGAVPGPDARVQVGEGISQAEVIIGGSGWRPRKFGFQGGDGEEAVADGAAHRGGHRLGGASQLVVLSKGEEWS